MKYAVIACAALTLCTSTALAIDFSQPITQFNGEPFTDKDGKPVSLTLATVAETALTATFPDESNLDPMEKVKRFALAQKIYGKNDADLTADEIALLKKLIGKYYGTMITGMSWKMLDPASVPK